MDGRTPGSRQRLAKERANTARQDRGAGAADALHRAEQVSLATDGGVLVVGGIALPFDHLDPSFDQFQPLILSLEFMAQSLGEMMTFRGDQRRKVNAGPAQLRLGATNALGEEQSLDAFDTAGALADQAPAFPMGATGIFLLDAWHSDGCGNMAFASVDSDERTQERQGIVPVALHTARSAIHLNT